MTEPIRVLIVEDSPDDAELMLLELRRAGYAPSSVRVETAEEMRAALQGGPWDIVLCDYALPQFGALDALAMARESGRDVPFVLVSGAVGEEVAVEAMRVWASDYVLKRNLSRLGPTVTRELREAENRSRRWQAEQAVRASESRFQAVVEKSFDAVVLTEAGGRLVYASPASTHILGRSPQELVGCDGFTLLHPDDLPGIRPLWEDLLRTPGGLMASTHRALRGGREWRWVETRCTNLLDDPAVRAVVINFRDVTEQREAGERLQQSQREAAEHLALLETLLGNAPVGFAFLDRQFRYVRVNDALGAMTGVPAAEMVGRTVAEVVPQVWPQVEPIYHRLLAGGGPSTNHEVRGETRAAPGQVRHWLASHYPVHLDGEVIGIGLVANEITERKRAEEALRLRDRAMRAVTQGIFISDADRPGYPIIYASPGFEALTGYAEEEVVGRDCRILHDTGTDAATLARITEAMQAERPWAEEVLNYRKDGTPFWNALSLSPVRDEGGRLTHFVGVQTDVTERRSLEEQFQQAQKMEAVGRLAGGVAHDFNNLLTIISGYSDVLLSGLRDGEPTKSLVREIRQAGEQAAGLTRQLLAFSHKTVLEPKVLDLNAQVREIVSMLRRLIGEDIELATSLDPDTSQVKADLGQLEQVVINLCVNARDVMPQGGQITVETQNVELGEAYSKGHADVRPGPYALLAVSDTGCGMDAATKARAFEPFFTTKEQGKGTGLGLAMVFGFVKQSGGHITVYSEPGKGTTFKIYLPRVEEAVASRKSDHGLGRMPRGTETLLLVEDEAGVRALARHVLQSCGYTVLEAGYGKHALRVAEQHAGPIHLLISDVVMPGGMAGRQVAEAVRTRHPEAKVLFVSGYTDEAVVRHGVVEVDTNFLQKPFTPAALAQKVREVLDASALSSPC